MFFGPLADNDGHNRETLGSGLEKSKKYFRLIMIRVTYIVEKSGFQKKFCLRKFLAESFSIRPSCIESPASKLVLHRGGLPSEIALQGRTLESEIVHRRVNPDFENRKNIFGS